MIFIELFTTFFVIGMFTIGGGYAMLSLIQNKVVTVHGWIDDTTFTDIVAISQMTPGPIGINSATYIGYQILANSGASEFMSILGSFTALKPATLGLIGTAALSLATPANFIDWKSYVLCLLAFLALYFKKLGPFSIIGIGAVAGLILY